MRDLVLTVLIFGSLPFILSRPWLGVLLWTWIGIMNPHRLSWGFAYDMPFAQIVGLVTLVAFFLSKEPKRVPMTPVTIILILFISWMAVTTVFAINADDAWNQWKKVMKIQLMIFLTLSVMFTSERIQMLVWATMGSLAFFGVKGGLFTIMTGGNNMVLGPSGSFIDGNTTMALALVMVLPLMRYLQLHGLKNKWLRLGMGASMALVAFAIVGSYSRGALLAAGAIAVFLWLKSRQKLVTGVGLLLLIPVMLMFMPEKWFGRMDTIEEYQQDASAMGRINAWWFAFNLAKERPLVGGGFETFSPDLFFRYAPNPTDFHDAHSIYFEVLGEQGFVGLALFLALMVAAWRTAAYLIRVCRTRDDLRWAGDLAAMTQVSIIGYAVGGAFLGLAYFDVYYILVAILVLTRQVVDERLRLEKRPVGRPNPVGIGGVSPQDGTGVGHVVRNRVQTRE